MQTFINKTTIELHQGDITKETTEAIVNAANTGLTGGGGVDGAIHKAGGPQIAAECLQYNGCGTGNSVITSGGNLQAQYVIHTVGPRYRGKKEDEKLLRKCYLSTLALAIRNEIRSVSFPSISTGIYGYPINLAAPIALKSVQDIVLANEGIDLVRFVLYSEADFKVYQNIFVDIKPL